MRYTHTRILFSHEKEFLLIATTWTELEGIMLSEMSERERQILYAITYIKFKKTELVETKHIMMIMRGWGMGKKKRCWLEDINFQFEDE